MNSSPAHIHQISISPGGVPKLAVPQARITRDGVEGDKQNDVKHHGGPERAVCLLAMEVIERLRAEGHPIAPGTTGENLTTVGLDWTAVAPGARLEIESANSTEPVELEVVSYTSPCSAIRESFNDLEFRRIKQDLHPGDSRVYARVRREGVVRTGATVRLIPGTSNIPTHIN
ncbi:MAG: MOSC domain-containing protein [Phycisphaerales bacterium]